MQIKIETIEGKTITINDVKPTDTWLDIKRKICQQRKNTNFDKELLIANSKRLRDSDSVGSTGDNTFIFLVNRNSSYPIQYSLGTHKLYAFVQNVTGEIEQMEFYNLENAIEMPSCSSLDFQAQLNVYFDELYEIMQQRINKNNATHPSTKSKPIFGLALITDNNEILETTNTNILQTTNPNSYTKTVISQFEDRPLLCKLLGYMSKYGTYCTNKYNQAIEDKASYEINVISAAFRSFCAKKNASLTIHTPSDNFAKLIPSQDTMSELEDAVFEVGFLAIHTPTDDFTILLHPQDTWPDLKKTILRQTGIPLSQQAIMFGDKRIDNDKSIIPFVELTKMGKINVVSLPQLSTVPTQIESPKKESPKKESKDLRVHASTGKHFNITIHPTDTWLTVKQRVFSQENIPVENQRFLILTQRVDNDEKIIPYSALGNIENIHLVYSPSNMPPKKAENNSPKNDDWLGYFFIGSVLGIIIGTPLAIAITMLLLQPWPLFFMFLAPFVGGLIGVLGKETEREITTLTPTKTTEAKQTETSPEEKKRDWVFPSLFKDDKLASIESRITRLEKEVETLKIWQKIP